MLRLAPRPLRRRTAAPRVPDEASLRHDVPRTWDELSHEACLGLLLATRDEPVGTPRRFFSTERLVQAVQRDEVRMSTAVRVGRAPATTAGRWLVTRCLLLGPGVHAGRWDRTRLEAGLERLLREQHVEIAARAAAALEDLGRFVADRSGASIKMGDLATWTGKAAFIEAAKARVEEIQTAYAQGQTTDGERYNHTIDAWMDCAERVAFEARLARGSGGPVDDVVASSKHPVEDRALRAMVGRAAAASGELRELPIVRSFGEGLTPHEHFMRALDVGYANGRQLERDVVVTELLGDLGAVLADVRITAHDCGAKQTVRDVTRCAALDGVCARCFGLDPLDGTWPVQGDEVGARAAWAIASGARAFWRRHLFLSSSGPPREGIRTIGGGVVRVDVWWVAASDIWGALGECITPGTLTIVRAGVETERFAVERGDELLVAHGDALEPGTPLAWKPVFGERLRADIPAGVEARVEWNLPLAAALDEVTGLVAHSIPQDGPDATVRLIDESGVVLQQAVVRAGSTVTSDHGSFVRAGQLLARAPSPRTSYGELLGVADLRAFVDGRVDRQQPAAVLAPFDGTVETVEESAIRFRADDGRSRRIATRRASWIAARTGKRVAAGDTLVWGSRSHRRLLRIHGEAWLVRHWMDEIEREQASRGIAVPRVYWALLLRSMLAWRRVLTPGDTALRRHDVLSRARYERIQRETTQAGGRPATAVTVLRGLRTIARRFIA